MNATPRNVSDSQPYSDTRIKRPFLDALPIDLAREGPIHRMFVREERGGDEYDVELTCRAGVPRRCSQVERGNEGRKMGNAQLCRRPVGWHPRLHNVAACAARNG
jgi:hypothetical protein